MEWADSNWLRAGGYLIVAALALWAGRREDPRSAGSWPPFWWLTAGLFTVMAVGRAGNVADLITDMFRDRAVDEGWYDERRRFQAVIVAGLGVAWLALVGIACWRVPARRRRYLPMIVVVLTIGAFAAIRSVSLHQLDSLLHRRHLAGVRYGTVIEYVLLVIAAIVTVWTPRRSLDRSAEAEPQPKAPPSGSALA